MDTQDGGQVPRIWMRTELTTKTRARRRNSWIAYSDLLLCV